MVSIQQWNQKTNWRNRLNGRLDSNVRSHVVRITAGEGPRVREAEWRKWDEIWRKIKIMSGFKQAMMVKLIVRIRVYEAAMWDWRRDGKGERVRKRGDFTETSSSEVCEELLRGGHCRWWRWWNPEEKRAFIGQGIGPFISSTVRFPNLGFHPFNQISLL